MVVCLGPSCGSNLAGLLGSSSVQVPLPLINTKNLKLVLQIFYAKILKVIKTEKILSVTLD